MRWETAVRWGLEAAWIAAALALIFAVGGWLRWIGYLMLGYFVVARVLLLVFHLLWRRLGTS
jgi:hypothetical protein